MGAQHGVMGDEDYGMAIPETEVAVADMQEIEKAAKFSRTKEYKRLKEYMQERVEFYQKFLPDGRPLTSVDTTERAQQWVIANAIIGELNMVLSVYEDAKEAVNVRRKGA